MAIPEEEEPTVRITSAAKKELHDEFTEQSYGQNFHFMKSMMPKGLKAIASKHTLKASQVQRQLCAWKGVAHGFHGIVYSHDTAKVKEAIACYCPSDTPEFVKSTLRAMIPSCWDDLVEKPNDYVWLVSMCTADPTKETMLQAILSDATTVDFFVNWVKQYTIFAADAFPRTASMLRAGDTEFARTRLLKKEEGQVKFLDLANDLSTSRRQSFIHKFRNFRILDLYRLFLEHSGSAHEGDLCIARVFSCVHVVFRNPRALGLAPVMMCWMLVQSLISWTFSSAGLHLKITDETPERFDSHAAQRPNDVAATPSQDLAQITHYPFSI